MQVQEGMLVHGRAEAVIPVATGGAGMPQGWEVPLASCREGPRQSQARRQDGAQGVVTDLGMRWPFSQR